MDEPRYDGDQELELDQELDFDPELAFDEELRQRLTAPARSRGPGTESAEQVLGGLRPRLVRARRVRRAQLAATILGPAVLLVGGLVALGTLTSPDGGQPTVAGQPDAAPTSVPEDRADRVTVEVTGTTELNTPTPGDQDATSDGGAGSTTLPADASDGTGPAPEDSSATVTSPTSSSAPSPTPGPSTSSQGSSTSVPGSELVESACGSIVVVVVESSVELIETLPDDGYDVDVKSSSPEVEVSFEGQGHCELKAEYERGRLETSVDDEPRN